MPHDHYISQVYLKKFYSPVLGNRMYAIRKTDLKTFTPTSKAVCRFTEGNTNAYLWKNRAIEDFLKTIEPKYDTALDKLIAGEIDWECIYTVAGFAAYVIACLPAGMRIYSEPIKSTTETAVAILERQGVLPPSPAQLGDTSFTELLRDGDIEIRIDPKYPQAIGISSILKLVVSFGNFHWDILHNDFDDNPFFTSDYPVAIEKTDHPYILNRVVSLAPHLAIRIRPDLTLDRGPPEFSFANFCYRRHNVSHDELVKLNRLIVRCAEDVVFYRDDHPWVRPFVAKNRYYHVEPHTYRLETSTGTLLVSTQRIVASASLVPPAPTNS
jgi:hypothetical protein